MGMKFSLPTVHHELLEIALEATELGATELTNRFRQRIRVQSKGLANFVTEADLAAEQVILETLIARLPNHRFLSEESQQTQVVQAEHLWIIDPLDGTSNFMHGIPHFAISIAYYRNQSPELGLVYNPITEDLYLSIAGQGAWHGPNKQHVDNAQSLSESMICCGFYYDRGRMMRATLETLASFFQQKIHGIRRFGAAALDLCNVGCGQYGVFFEYKLHPWDFAAGMLFVHEAGGSCTDCSGNPLPLLQPSSLCATNGHLHDAALRVIQPHWENLNASPW